MDLMGGTLFVFGCVFCDFLGVGFFGFVCFLFPV